MSACKFCGARIRWARSAVSGKPMPLDPEPYAGGNVRLNAAGQAEVARPGRELEVLIREGVALYVHHKVTCRRDAA